MHGNKKVAVCDDYVLDGRQVLFFIQEDLLLNLWLNQDLERPQEKLKRCSFYDVGVQKTIKILLNI